MPIINSNFRTVSCDSCDKTVTFEASNGLPKEVMEANPWLKSNRAVQRADGLAVFSYCSDLCEVKGIESGNHNTPEPKTLAPVTGGSAAIALAAAEARRKQLTDEKLREGAPVNVKLS